MKDSIVAIAQKELTNAAKMFNINLDEFDVSIETEEKGTAAGTCWSLGNKYVLTYNVGIAKKNGIEAFNNTITHEIAHMIQKIVAPHAKQAHGPEFKRIHKALGGTGKTYHNYDIQGLRKRKVKRHVYDCGCTEHQLTTGLHNKIVKLSGRGFSCKKCLNGITYVKTIIVS